MKLFREKSLTKVNSPEQLNEYMKVTSTPIWINLIAIIFLLLGICMWALIGQLETTISLQAQGDGNTAYSEIDSTQKEDIQIGAKIICDGYHGSVTELLDVENRIKVISHFQESVPDELVCELTTSSTSWFSLLFPMGKLL